MFVRVKKMFIDKEKNLYTEDALINKNHIVTVEKGEKDGETRVILSPHDYQDCTIMDIAADFDEFEKLLSRIGGAEFLQSCPR